MIQNSSGTIKFIYNSTTEASLSSAGILTCNGLPSINTLSNVSISSLSTNQILQYNGSNCVNATISTGGPSTLAADTDCSISSPATNQALIYNSSSKWAYTYLTHNLFTVTSITSINKGVILRWNATQFVNSSPLTNDETILNTGIVLSTGITKTQSITQNTLITRSYVDGTDSYITYTTGNSLYYPTIQSLKFFDCNLTAAIASGGTYITPNIWLQFIS